MRKRDNRRYLELGQSYRESKDYDLAIEELKRALKFGYDDAELHLELGRVYREIKDFDSAIKELNRAIEFNLNDNEAYLELGRTYREKGEYHKAIEELNTALTINSSDGRIYLEIGRVYQQKRDYDSGQRELEKAVALGLDNVEVHLELSRTYREKKKYAEAIDEFKAALRHDASSARMHLELGWIYHDNENYELAVKELEEALRLGIDSEELHISLGRMYRKIGKHEFSVREFKTVIDKSSDRDDTFFKNKMLNEIEISQGKIVLESKPIGLGITLTSKCNLRCMMCDIWKEPWEIPKKTIQEVIALFPYLERIVWQGGEVFLLSYFNELFEEAVLYPNLKQTIITNGLLIDDKWAEKLSRDNVCLTYSVDAVDRDTYEYITGGKSKFGDLIRSIKLINKYRQEHDCHKDPFNKMTTIINVVVMESNYHQLENFVDFAKEYQFDEVQLVPILGLKESENIFLNKNKKAREYLVDIFPKVLKKAQGYNIVLHNWLPQIESEEVTPLRGNEQKENCLISEHAIRKSKEVICFLPWQQMFMTPDRKLKPGCYCSKEIGDINISSLKEIWNGKVIQQYRRKLLDNDFCDLCDSMCVSGTIPKKELKVSRYW